MNSSNPDYKIGLYVRNSDFKQDTPEGTIKNQEQRLRQFVELRNSSCQFGEIKQVYIDRSLSAKNMNRPRLQGLLKDISDGAINMVAVSELSRITRSMKDFSIVWELFKKHNCGFLSLRENVDTSNAAGEMVMFMLANIAQFERKQTSERVSASRKIRASRGLFNGGVIPLGFQINPDRPGYLLIEPQGAKTVKKAFDYYLKHQALSKTAKALNKDGIKIKRTMQGGGRYSRLDFFTVDNLHKILTNKAYKAVVSYKDGEQERQAKAVWKAIISTPKFDRVQGILKKNHSRKKPFTITRYPYLLSGLTSCESCGDVMSGKSAHGVGGKYGYYEHGWASKKGSTHAKETFKCHPHRISAIKLETAIIDNIHNLMVDSQLAKSIIKDAHRIHKQDDSLRLIKNLQNKISGYNSNLDALVERLGELPKGISASLIYKQMGKLEAVKKEAMEQLNALQSMRGQSTSEMPADFASYQNYLKLVGKSLDKATNSEDKAKIIRTLIFKLEIGVNSVNIHYYVGKEKLREAKASRGVLSLVDSSSSLGHGGA